jgi:hypothetical protein
MLDFFDKWILILLIKNILYFFDYKNNIELKILFNLI